jgi:DNA-binding transcriptional LysR family regulator
MELRQLRYFLALCRTMNFTRAAEEVNIAQPPFSRQIGNLEDELGVRLIDRDSRPLRLTSSGLFFQERAQEIVTRIDRLKHDTVRFGRGGRQILRIGFEVYALYGHLPPVIKHLRALNPHLDIDLKVMAPAEQVQGIRNGAVDVGLSREPAHDDHIDQIIIRREPYVVAVPPGHPLARHDRPALRFADLAEETIIRYHDHAAARRTDPIVRLMERAHFAPMRETRLGDVLAALGLVAAEAGVCVVPATVQRMRSDDVRYLPLDEEGAWSDIYLATAKGWNSPILQQTKEELDRLVAEHEGRG